MKEHSFEMPIAINRNTNKIVHVNDVDGGIKCNCYCPICNEDLIAINKEENIQRPHFRHNKNANCSSNGESYIHWLTKEVFKDINQIFLPPITYSDFEINLKANNNFRNKLKKYFEKKDLLPEFDRLIFTNFQLQSKSTIEINGCESEVHRKSNFGDIDVDVVLKVCDMEIFIEPYFTNKIDENKRKKIFDLDISTISINLISFVRINGWFFTIDDFKNFLINDIKNKKWEYIRTQKIDNLSEKFIKMLDKEVKEHEIKIPRNKETKRIIKEKRIKYEQLLNDFNELKREIELLEKKIIPFPFEKLFVLSPLHPLQINKNHS